MHVLCMYIRLGIIYLFICTLIYLRLLFSRSSSRMGGVGNISTSKFSLSRQSKVTIGSRGNLASGTRKGLQSGSQAKMALASIINEKGEDVTPKPLIRAMADSGVK